MNIHNLYVRIWRVQNSIRNYYKYQCRTILHIGVLTQNIQKAVIREWNGNKPSTLFHTLLIGAAKTICVGVYGNVLLISSNAITSIDSLMLTKPRWRCDNGAYSVFVLVRLQNKPFLERSACRTVFKLVC